MVITREAFESSYRLARINKIKKILYTAQIIMMIGFGVILLLWQGGQFKPFFIPVDAFLSFVIFMLLILYVESFFFKMLELKYGQSESGKFLLTKNGIKRGFIVMILCAIVLVLLLSPLITEDRATDHKKIVSANDNTIELNTRDPLGLTRIKTIELSTPSENWTEVAVTDKDIYELNPNQTTAKYNFDQTNLTPTNTITTRLPDQYKNLVIYFRPEAGARMRVDYENTVAVSPIFSSYIPLLALCFIVASGAWIGYLTPKKKKFAVTSIYG